MGGMGKSAELRRHPHGTTNSASARHRSFVPSTTTSPRQSPVGRGGPGPTFTAASVSPMLFPSPFPADHKNPFIGTAASTYSPPYQPPMAYMTFTSPSQMYSPYLPPSSTPFYTQPIIAGTLPSGFTLPGTFHTQASPPVAATHAATATGSTTATTVTSNTTASNTTTTATAAAAPTVPLLTITDHRCNKSSVDATHYSNAMDVHIQSHVWQLYRDRLNEYIASQVQQHLSSSSSTTVNIKNVVPLSESAPPAVTSVTLRLGSTRFTVDATLLRQAAPHSLFPKLLDQRFQVDLKDDLIIERDAKWFPRILAFLRDGQSWTQVDVPRDRSDRRELRLEAEFYGLDRLVHLLQPSGFVAYQEALRPDDQDIQQTESALRKQFADLYSAPCSRSSTAAATSVDPISVVEKHLTQLDFAVALASSRPTQTTALPPVTSITSHADTKLYAQTPSKISHADIKIDLMKNSLGMNHLIDVFENRTTWTSVATGDEKMYRNMPYPLLGIKHRPISVEPLLTETLDQVTEQWNAFSLNVFRELDWTGVLVAGGAALATLGCVPESVRVGKANDPPPSVPPSSGWRRAADSKWQPREQVPLLRYYHGGSFDGPNDDLQLHVLNCYNTRDGAVLSPFRYSDIDLFFYGLTAEQAYLRLQQIERLYQRYASACRRKMVVLRTDQAVTFSAGWPLRNVQVILRLYHNPAEILVGFDLDACAVGYAPQYTADRRAHVWILPRTRRAFQLRCNLVDPERQSLTYESRLAKYAERGFAVAVPGYDASRLHPNLVTETRTHVVYGLARLLLLLRKPVADGSACSPSPRYPYFLHHLGPAWKASSWSTAPHWKPYYGLPDPEHRFMRIVHLGKSQASSNSSDSASLLSDGRPSRSVVVTESADNVVDDRKDKQKDTAVKHSMENYDGGMGEWLSYRPFVHPITQIAKIVVHWPADRLIPFVVDTRLDYVWNRNCYHNAIASNSSLGLFPYKPCHWSAQLFHHPPSSVRRIGQFLTHDPGQQGPRVGSFHPTSHRDWFIDAYVF